MSDFARDRLDLDDEDRLPWLEPADDFEEDRSALSPLKLLGFVVLGLAVLALVVALVYGARTFSASGTGGAGKLIAAPKGDYKVPAAQADAKKFAGEGDASFAASEGVAQEGKIDPSRQPEAPVVSGAAGKDDAAHAPQSTAKPSASVTTTVTTVAAGTSAGTRAATAASGGPMIQLGAYGSAAMAKDAWAKLSRRFDYLAALGNSVEPVEVGGTTLYRLRAGAGSSGNAAMLCGKLKVAGENCMVVN